MNLFTLIGLPDAARKKVRAGVFRSVSGAGRVLRVRQYATASGSNGAINLWRTKHGLWRGERYFLRTATAGVTCTSKRSLLAWLKSELPEIL
jgi:hypothetical protein